MKQRRGLFSGLVAAIILLIVLPLSVSAVNDDIKLPKEKQDILNKEHEERANAPKTPKEKDKGLIKVDREKLKSKLASEFITGIYDGEAPPGVHDVSIQNIWQGKDHDKYLRVYAGKSFSVDGLEEGVIIIESRDELMDTLSFDFYKPSNNGGSLKILDEKQGKLALIDAQNNTLQFDISNRSFTE